MEFPTPNDVTYTIYSKSNCLFCDKVKELLKDVVPKYVVIDCDEFLTDPDTKKNFLEFIAKLTKRQYKTFPMVFHGDRFIGGFNDTRDYYENNDL
jgi:glutaredoxin